MKKEYPFEMDFEEEQAAKKYLSNKNLNHTHEQDINIMDYQKRQKAGLINEVEISKIQRHLQCVIASLKNVNIINPYATLINLPDDVPHPRKSLLLLLNFIETITFFFQYQRETIDKTTGDS